MNDQEWVDKVKISLKNQLIGDNSATLLEETYLTCTEGVSNKFHLFVLYKFDAGTTPYDYIAGNAYGRIIICYFNSCLSNRLSCLSSKRRSWGA